jgi:MFS family permease
VRRRFRAGAEQTFRSMHVRNFRIFFGGQFISQVGNWLTFVAQTLLVLHLTDSGFQVGLLTACQFAPVLLFGAWAGVVADRADKRKLLIVVQGLAMAQSFALAALAFSGDPPLLAIYGVAFVGGCTVAFDNPARRSFVTEMVPETHVNNAVSLNTAIMMSSRIFGPALAGLLVSTVGYGWCFTADALSYIAVIVGLSMMNPAELRPAPVASRAKGQVREGLRHVRTVPDLWIPLVMMAVVGMLTYNFQVVIPLFVKQTLHGGDGTFTLLYSVISVGSLVGALVVARREAVTVPMVVTAAFAFGVAMCLFAGAPGLAVAFPLGVLVGAASVWFMTSSTAIMQLRAEPEIRGRVLALQSMVFLGSTPIGGPIVGLVCEVLSPRAGILLGGVAALAAGLYGRAAGRGGRVSSAPAPAGRIGDVEPPILAAG